MSFLFFVGSRTNSKGYCPNIAESKTSPSLTRNMTNQLCGNFTWKISSLELEIEKLKDEKNSLCPLNSKKAIKPTIYRSCLELLNNGFNKSGKYEIKPYLNVIRTVYCDQETDGGGWTVFFRNAYGLIHFKREWYDFKRGFGNVETDFWLGNDFMYNVTQLYNSYRTKTVELFVILGATNNQSYFGMYKHFAILSESMSYTLLVSDYFKGSLDDQLSYHNNSKFATRDKDPSNCINSGYGWWFQTGEGYCGYLSFLTKMNYDISINKFTPQPYWYGLYYSLRNATMMYREKKDVTFD